MPIDPQQTYVHLDSQGAATEVPGGAAFWSLSQQELGRFGRGWLVSEYSFASDWPNWEMHPNGDELVYLLAGEADLILEERGGPRLIALRGTGAVVVPRGIWHTAKIHVPCRMLHVTLGDGTQSRPV